MNTPIPLPFLQNGYNSKSERSHCENTQFINTPFQWKNRKKTLGGGVKKKMMITKIRRNTKALSPIFAVLILIAIAVIAGIVVYMFTSGTIASLTGGGTAGQEKAAVQGVDLSGTNVAVYASYVSGGADIELNGAIIKDAGGNIVAATATGWSNTLPMTGTLETLDTGIPVVSLSAGSYTVTLTSEKGGSFVSSSFVP